MPGGKTPVSRSLKRPGPAIPSPQDLELRRGMVPGRKSCCSHLALTIIPPIKSSSKTTPSPTAKISASNDIWIANSKRNASTNSFPAPKLVAKTAFWRRSARKQTRIVLSLPPRWKPEAWKKCPSQTCWGMKMGQLRGLRSRRGRWIGKGTTERCGERRF